MAQISLPDTAVIDLATVQTIVNALNRHDEVLSQLVSAYATPPKTDTNDTATTFNTIFNGTTHQIQFGRIKLNQTETSTPPKFEVSFETPFSGVPTVVASARYTSSDTTPIFASLATVNDSGFTGWVSENHTVVVSWIAIGTRTV